MKPYLFILLTALCVSCAALKPTVTVSSDGKTNTTYVVKDGVAQALTTAGTVAQAVPFPWGTAATGLISLVGAGLAGLATAKSHSNGQKLDEQSAKLAKR